MRPAAAVALAAALGALGGCRGQITSGGEARGVSSAVAQAAINPQFVGSEPLPQFSLDRARPARPAARGTSSPAVPSAPSMPHKTPGSPDELLDRRRGQKKTWTGPGGRG